MTLRSSPAAFSPAALAIAASLMIRGAAVAQQGPCASALLREGLTVSVDFPAPIVGFGDTTANHSGGFAVVVLTERAPFPPLELRQFNHIWGADSPDTPPGILCTDDVLGIPGTNWVVGHFEGVVALGSAIPDGSASVVFSAGMTKDPAIDPYDLFLDQVHGFTDSLWSGKSVTIMAGNPIEPTPAPLIGDWYWTYASNPAVTADGREVWRGGLAESAAGPTQIGGLFQHIGSDSVPLFLGGQAVAGLPGLLHARNPVGRFDVSALGLHCIAHVRLALNAGATPPITTSNDEAVVLISDEDPPLVLAREGDLIGIPGAETDERWAGFGFCRISTGATGVPVHHALTARTTAPAARALVLVQDGAIVRRAGQTVEGAVLLPTVTGLAMNNSGDVASIWGIAGSGRPSALLLGNDLLLRTGGAIDIVNAQGEGVGDGVVDPTWVLRSMNGLGTLSLSDRQPTSQIDSAASIYFIGTAGIATSTPSTFSDQEAFFKIELAGLGPAGCPGDWNHIDGLDSQDYFDFMDDFFVGDADFNGDQATDSQDFFDFLNAFFSGCA